ncbi:hypothetical protein NpPPO83_00010609 [Neofusicoccum parvum]|uniref:Uncharacterized protein n=1 Tax=Neofusicoccum parvum TaxID=310453 RepID=A0ACB5SLM3_9PEZI|nr:hypothetical protein NpPPO83_00010609 [Neofusicoccum parvum]
MPHANASTAATASLHPLTFIPIDPSAAYTTPSPSPAPARHPAYRTRWAAPLSPSSFASPATRKRRRADAWTAEEKERCLQALTLIWERAPGMGKMEAWGMAGRLMGDVWGMSRSADAVAKVWRAELGAVWAERRRARGVEVAAGAEEGAVGMAEEGEEGEREERDGEIGGRVGEEQRREWFGGELSKELEKELFGGELSELSEELERDLFSGELGEENCEELSKELSEELERELFGGDEDGGEE